MGLRTTWISALDIGTTKICCFIARSEKNRLNVVGIGHGRSLGVRNGVVISMEEVESSIRAAVASAEQMARRRIDQVLVNISCGQLHSSKIEICVSLDGRPISDDDVKRIITDACHKEIPHDRDLIHCIAIGYSIDGTNGIRDPRGMFGSRLGVNLHTVTARAGIVRNLRAVVERCHLEVEALVVSPYASALACLADDEREAGVTVIDMGGGTSTVALFKSGQAIHMACLPIGGMHVTSDISHGLSTPVTQAERLKTLYGSAVPLPSDAHGILHVPLTGIKEESAPVPRSMLVQIIRPRIEETFELVRSHLAANSLTHNAGHLVVLTGGASQLKGVLESASLILNKRTRLGHPVGIRGVAETMRGPEFSTCTGMLKYAAHVKIDSLARTPPLSGSSLMSRLERIGKRFLAHC